MHCKIKLILKILPNLVLSFIYYVVSLTNDSAYFLKN